MNTHLSLGGPEALSWRNVIATVGRILDRDISIVTLAAGQRLPGLPEIVTDLMAGLDTYDSVIPMTETATKFGVTPTSVDAFARGMLAQRPAG